MKFDDIVHFTGGRTVCPPATRPVPLRPLSKIKTAAAGHPPQAPRVIIVQARVPWVSRFPPARSVAGHLIPGSEGRTCVKSLACYYVLLISLEFVCALRMAPSRSCALIDI